MYESLFPDNEEVFEQLVKITCPPVCVGMINETGWHRICIDKAAQAMRILLPFESVDKWIETKIKDIT